MIDAILWVAGTAEVACVTETLDHWHFIYARMKRWANAGVLDRLSDTD